MISLLGRYTRREKLRDIIVNTMQSYSETERQETVSALQQSQDQIEMDVQDELRALREEIRELKTLLAL